MAKINVLLLSGQNNHDWKRSSPFIKELLEGSGRFAVTMTENPSEALADAAALRKYQLFFNDYNGPEWSPAAKASFETAVRGGTGLVALHAANNAFKGWIEYEKMLAVLWREGTGHGEFHEFLVKIVEPDHPIARGVPDFRTWDELYHRLVPMHNAPYQVLATAYSDPAKGGSGRDEPMMLVTQYGRGRVFHQVLGHIWPGDPNGAYKGASLIALDNEHFKNTTLRGSEWAATGSVRLA